MAIIRDSDTRSRYSGGGTTAPNSSFAQTYQKSPQTADTQRVQSEYSDESESKAEDKMITGALLPKDMTVRLVRVESHNIETMIQILYTFTLTLFGVFLGALISNQEGSASTLEIIATIVFFIISVALVSYWIKIKLKQSESVINVPYDLLSRYTVSTEEPQ